MAVKEHAIGKGTIAYHGESPEYWAQKTRRLPVWRPRITIGLAMAGLLLVVYAGSPLAPTAVTGVVTQAVLADGGASTRAVVAYPDGSTTKHETITLPGPYSEGQDVALLVRGGSAYAGDALGTESIWVIGVLLLLVAGGRRLWAWRHRGEVTTFS